MVSAPDPVSYGSSPGRTHRQPTNPGRLLTRGEPASTGGLPGPRLDVSSWAAATPFPPAVGGPYSHPLHPREELPAPQSEPWASSLGLAPAVQLPTHSGLPGPLALMPPACLSRVPHVHSLASEVFVERLVAAVSGCRALQGAGQHRPRTPLSAA